MNRTIYIVFVHQVGKELHQLLYGCFFDISGFFRIIYTYVAMIIPVTPVAFIFVRSKCLKNSIPYLGVFGKIFINSTHCNRIIIGSFSLKDGLSYNIGCTEKPDCHSLWNKNVSGLLQCVSSTIYHFRLESFHEISKSCECFLIK